ncbi:hypothetical protein [Chelatococcus asaccharovorans]|uniref:Lipoprotein n=1 Tax=Chelatococcus asaccharovorans TaxID=28210 RepID=A0A2V3U253_9HYPH|nr:hypothetical protein [Chelatococcus asaccharovorans]MBS7704254.1 hypothetical protein [Chelatococcus asaccharovorans]PXW55872.1 hypothetical protein C7450_109285 [Chelatococcus asaccharovorans]CAH1665144.1 conserved exported hypothetical protein [Chelatococcus asaccharovorans]CAH1682105.1 conserved exported hypothetical protein [Chelatococcus asaccharovorans]
MLSRLTFAVPLLLGLAACNTTAEKPPAAQAYAAAPDATVAAPLDSASLAGRSCGAPILGFRRIIDSDVQVGHLSPSVYKAMAPEVGRAANACAQGNDGQALAMLAAVKSRNGYP